MILDTFWVVTLKVPVDYADVRVSGSLPAPLFQEKGYMVAAGNVEEVIKKVKVHFKNEILSIERPESQLDVIV